MGRKVVGTPLEGYVRWADGLCDIFSTRLMCFGWRWCWCCSSSQFSSRMQEAGCRTRGSGCSVLGSENGITRHLRSTPNCAGLPDWWAGRRSDASGFAVCRFGQPQLFII